MFRVITKAVLSLALVAGLAGLSGCNGARDNAWRTVNSGKTGFLVKSIQFDGSEQKYGLFIPHSYTDTKKYPVIIFLHGVGEGGNDVSGPLHVGLAPFVADQQTTFPFIVIFPQSGSGSWSETSSSAKEVIAVFEQVKKDYSVDTGCVTLTGLSTGGYGTWAIGATNKQYFSALVPMGSSANPEKFAAMLTDMPIRSYHNFGDPFAAEWNDSNMADKVNKLGGKVQYYQTNGGGHDCWSEVYSGTELFNWMQAQRKRGSTVTPTPTTPASTPTKSTGSVTPSPSSPAGNAPVKASSTPSKAGESALVPTTY